ncbi:MAG: hypothetical protein ACW98D_09105 [Promethearchaeota archaeon]|jgi:hypothetical protein
MANGDLTPNNFQFQAEDLDINLKSNLDQGPPSDQEYDLMFQEFSNSVNSIVYPNYKSYTGTEYSPYKSNVELNDSEETLLKGMRQVKNSASKNPTPIRPIMFNKRLTNYERYSNHPKFQELGFNPFRDNESLYNENSSFADDFSRMTSQFPKLFYTGFVSSYRSIGDLFDDDSYFTGKDLDSAREFADAMRIGNSTRGGVGGFLNNLGLQSAYTFGIVANIAAEEALLSFATGGGSLFTAPLRGTKRALESVVEGTRLRQVAENTTSLMNGLNNVEKSKTAYDAIRTGDSKLMSFLLPETMKSRQLLNTTSNTIDNLTEIGKRVKTFGGFYRDMRSLNYALSEAKMEAGMVYDERIANGLAEKTRQSETGQLSDKEIQLIKDNANKSAMTTTLLNAPFIYFTNQLLLGNAFGTYNRSLARMLSDNTDALAKRTLRIKPKLGKDGKLLKEGLITKSDTGFKGFMQTRFQDGIAKGSAGMALRYFAANFGEGVQEVYQEAVSHGVGNYYDSIIKDPISGTKDLFFSTLSESVASQISGQGFHTFMSGFMMGGLVGPVQNIAFQGIPNFTRKYITDREGYAKEKAQFEEQLDLVIDDVNKAYSSFKKGPKDFLDLNTANAVVQKQVSEDMQEAVTMDSFYDYIEGKGISKFVNIHTLVSNGNADMFRAQLEDYLKLSDKDILTAFPALKEEVKNGKAKERLQSYIKEIDRVEDLYIKNKNKYINPFDPSMFDPETQPEKYIEEALKKKAYDHASYLAIFTSNQMARAGERLESLFQKLQNDPIYSEMAANDLTVLLSEKTLKNELSFLKTEIESLENSEQTDDVKDQIKQKQTKLKDLEDINDYLDEKHGFLKQLKNRQKAKGKTTELNWGKFKKEKFKKLFVKYINNLADNKDQSVNLDKVDDYIKIIFDYSKLQIDKSKYRNTLLALADPKKFDDLYRRSYEKGKLDKENELERIKKFIYSTINNESIKNWINDLEDEGIYPDIQEIIDFVSQDFNNTSMLLTFRNKNGDIIEIDDKIAQRLEALEDIIVKIEEEKESQENLDDGIFSEQIIDLIKNFNFLTPKLLEEQEEAIFTELKEKILKYLYKNDSNSSTYSDAKLKYEDSLNDILSGLIVVLNNEPNYSYENAKELLIDYLNDNISIVSYKNFLNNIFETTDENLELRSSLLSMFEQENSELEEELNNKIESIAQKISGGSFLRDQLSDEEKEIYNQNKIYIDSRAEEIAKGIDDTFEKIELFGRIFTIQKNINGFSIVQLDEDGKIIQIEKNVKNFINTDTFTFANEQDAINALNILSKKEDDSLYLEFEVNGKEITIKNNQQVYDKNNEPYTVIINEWLTAGKVSLIDSTGTVKSYDIDTFFENYTTEKIKEQGSNIISSVNNDVLIIPQVKQEVFKFLMTYFNLDSSDFSIVIRPREQTDREDNFQPNKKEEPNKNIKRVDTPYDVQIVISNGLLSLINEKFKSQGIVYDSNTIGFLNTGNIAYYDNNNNKITDPTKITKEQAKLFYNIQSEESYNDLINNLATQAVLVNKLGILLGDKQELSITPKEFVDQTGIVFSKFQAYEYSKKENQEISIDEIIYYGDGPYVLVRNVFKKGKYTYETISTSFNTLDQAESLLEEANKRTKVQGYLYITQLPNGDLIYIPLKSKTLNEQELKEELKKIRDKSANAEKTKASTSESDVFVALKRGEYLDIYVKENGDVNFVYNNLNSELRIIVTIPKADFQNFSFESLDVVIKQINDKIKELYTAKGLSDPYLITKNSFKQQFAKDANEEVVLKSTKTKIKPGVYLYNNLKLIADSNDIAAVKNRVEDTQDNVDNEEESAGQKGKKTTETSNQNNNDEALYSNMSKEDLLELRSEYERGRTSLEKEKAIRRKKLRKQNLSKEEIKNDTEIKSLEEQVDKLSEIIDGITQHLLSIQNLVIDESHTNRSVEDINTFIDWLQKNLPEFITVSDLNQLKSNMLKGGKRVGAFMIALKNISGGIQPGGSIFTTPTSPGKYHEAFHAVFRLLLSDEQISKFIKIGRKELKDYYRKNGKNYNQELKSFRNQSKAYERLSEKQLEQLFIEEYIAERFDEFKSNPKSTKTNFVLKSLFNRIIQFIKDALGKFTNLNNKSYNKLNELFIDIDSGKYKSANLMDNRFVNEFKMGSMPVVNSLVPYSGKEGNYKYLDSITGDTLINQIYARVIVKQEKSIGKFDIDKTIDESIELYTDLYENNIEEQDEKKIFNVLNSLDKYEDQIKQEVKERLKLINITQQKLDNLVDQEINEVGLNTTNHNQKAELVGMEKSLPEFVRKYFASTTMKAEDMFGNEILTEEYIDEDGNLVPAEPIYKAVNFADAYAGFLRATHDSFNHNEMFYKILLFSKNGNPETKAVVDRMLLDLGVSFEDAFSLMKEVLDNNSESTNTLNSLISQKNGSFLFHKIFKAFENSRFPYRFVEYNSENNTTTTYDAVEKASKGAQLQKWSNDSHVAYSKNTKTDESKNYSLNILNDVLRKIELLNVSTRNKSGAVLFNDEQLRNLSNLVSKNIFQASGISFHPNYVFYSLATLFQLQTASDSQIEIKFNQDFYSGITPIDFTSADGNILNTLKYYIDTDSFMFTVSDTFQKDLNTYAYGNINFDESVGSATFMNPEKERIYAHQAPTPNAKFASRLNADPVEFINESLSKHDILLYNFLASTDKDGYNKFIDFVSSGNFRYERIAGIIEKLNFEDSSSSSYKKEGKSYGKLNDDLFLRVLLSQYFSSVDNFKGKMKSKSSLVFTRVAETSRTGGLFNMPIIKSVEENSENLTQEVVDIFYNYVKGEFERIKKESNSKDSELLLGFNAVKDGSGELIRDENKTGRAFELYKTRAFLNNNSQELSTEELSITNKQIYSKIANSTIGQLIVGSKTKLGKNLNNTEDVFKVEIKSGKKNVVRYMSFKELKDGNVVINFNETYNSLIDDRLSKELEKLANDSKNKDKTFEQIIEDAFSDKELVKSLDNSFEVESGVTNFQNLLRSKLEREFQKFLEILELNSIDLNNKKYLSVLNGYSKDLSSIKNERLKRSIDNNLKITNSELNLVEPSNKIEYGADQERNLKQIFFNNYINSFSINQLIRGDHARIFKSYQEEIKRGKDQETQIISTKSYMSSPELGIKNPVDSFDVVILDEIINNSSFTGEEIEEADGQLYMTVNAFRHAWFGIGALTPEQSEILNKLEKGEKLTANEVWGTLNSPGAIQRKEMINPKKFVYSDAENLVKMSAHVLRKEDTSIKIGKDKWIAKPNMIVLHYLREKLEQHEAATNQPTMAAPLSAIKKIKKEINSLQKILDTSENSSVKDVKSITLDAMFFGLQMVNPSNKNEVADTTQITFLLQNEQNDNQEVFINGEPFFIRDIKKAFQKNKSDILKLNYKGKKNLIFESAVDEFKNFKTSGKVTPNMISFVRYALESLKASNSNTDILEFFDMSNSLDFQGTLNNPRVIQKYEELLWSYFSKSVLKQKLPGSQLTMKSDFGDRVYRRVYTVRKIVVNGETMYIPDRQEVIREAVALKSNLNDYEFHVDYNKNTNKMHEKIGSDKNLKGLKEAVENAGEEGIIIIDRLRYDMSEYVKDEKTGEFKKTNKKYSEAKMAIQDRELYEKFGDLKEGKFNNTQLQNLYKEWLELNNVISKKGNLIKRKDLKNWDDKKGKITFAKQMKTWYDAKTDTFGGVQYDKIPDVVSKIFALRVPTQDKHSALNIKIVDFMSVSNGSAISNARELVEVSGADFDIDKLFAHFKEYYFNEKTKQFVEYGLDSDIAYYEYVQYINKKVKEPGTIYFEAYEKFKAQGGLGQIKLDESAREYAKENKMSEEAMYALAIIGMPVTNEQFVSFEAENNYTPSTAALNNKVLDYKSALIANDSITEEQDLYEDSDGSVTTSPKDKVTGNDNKKINKKLSAVAYDPADMEPLKKILKTFKGKFPEWAKTVLEDVFDNDNMTGALLAYVNNQIGSRLIGAAVLPNTYLPLLGSLGIKINKFFELDINGYKFNKYGSILEKKKDKDGDLEYGDRTQYVMSAIITAMTDNAKQQYAGKFNININSLGVISNMVMLGVPLETSIMMTMNPHILKNYKDFDSGFKFKKALGNNIKSIKALSEKYKFDLSENINDSQLENLINDYSNLEDVFDTIKENGITEENKEYLSSLYSLLLNYEKASNLSDYNFNLGTLFSLQKGINKTTDVTNIEEAIKNLDLRSNKDKLKENNHPFDARKLFVENNPNTQIIRTNYDIYNDLKKDVFSKLVLTQTEMFDNLLNLITDKNILGYVSRDGKEKIKYDLASYLIAKKYLENIVPVEDIENNKRGKIYADTILNANGLIYPIDNEGNQNPNNLIDYIFKDEEILPQSKDNFFLNEFINYIDAKDNSNGIYMLKNNMMSKIPENKKLDIIDDFKKLYENQNTKDIAMAIFHYLLAKDGLQYSYGSILQSISPIVMKDYYMSSTAEIFDDFSNSKLSLGAIRDYFQEFVENYFISSSSFMSNNFGFKKLFGITDLGNLSDPFDANRLRSEQKIQIYNQEDLLIINPYGLVIESNESKELESNPKVSESFQLESKNLLKEKGIYFENKSKLFKFSPYYQVEINGQKVTYKLKSLVTSKGNLNINLNEKSYLGYYAQYEIAKPLGARNAWGAGFLFGARPEMQKIEEFLLANEQDVLEEETSEEIPNVEILSFSKNKESLVKKLIEEYMTKNKLNPNEYDSIDSLVKEHSEAFTEENQFEDYLECSLKKNLPF